MGLAEAPEVDFKVSLSAAQLEEVWATDSDTAALKKLAEIIGLEEFDEEPRNLIWVEFLYTTVAFAKEQALPPKKALAFFDVMVATEEHAVATMASKEGAFRFFSDQLLATTKALPLADRFSLAEVAALTNYVRTSFLQCIKLHELVFTQQQTTRESFVELYVQTPAEPPPMSTAQDAAEAAAAEAAAAAELAASEQAAAAAAAEAAAEAAAAAANEPDSGNMPAEAQTEAPSEGSELTDAISKAVTEQAAALRAQLEAEYASQEQAMLARISALESK